MVVMNSTILHFRWVVCLAAAVMLGACSGQEDTTPDLSRYHSKGVPDEFAVVVYERINIPERSGELMAPGVQGTRVLQNPGTDADRALGGRVASRRDGQSPSGDSPLLAHMSSLGSRGDIRQLVASEDLEHRRANPGRYLEKVFGSNIYYRAYEDMTLDAYEETRRLTERGYRVLPAPPEDSG